MVFFMHLECARLPGGFLHTLFALLVQRFQNRAGDLFVHLLIGRIEQVGENRPPFYPPTGFATGLACADVRSFGSSAFALPDCSVFSYCCLYSSKGFNCSP